MSWHRLRLAICAGIGVLFCLPLLACEITTQRVGVDQGHIVYNTAGQGQTVMLLHGLFAQKEQWNELLCTLADSGYRAIAPDLPGYGQSTDFGIEAYPLEQQVALLTRFTRTINAQTRHVAGNSMGGAIAAMYAQAHPETTQTLTFIGGTLGVGPWAPTVRDAIFSGINPFIPTSAAALDIELAMLLVNPPTLSETAKTSTLAPYRQHTEHYVQVWNIVNLYQGALKDTQPSPIATLILWGAQDRVFDITSLPQLSGQYPRHTIHALPEAGHLAMLDAPQAVSKAYLKFLAGQ